MSFLVKHAKKELNFFYSSSNFDSICGSAREIQYLIKIYIYFFEKQDSIYKIPSNNFFSAARDSPYSRKKKSAMAEFVVSRSVRPSLSIYTCLLAGIFWYALCCYMIDNIVKNASER